MAGRFGRHAIVVIVVAACFGISFGLHTVFAELDLSQPWRTIVALLAGGGMFGGVVFIARWLGTRYERSRQAGRAHTTIHRDPAV